MIQPRIVGVVLLAGFYVWQTYQQIQTWENNPSLWSHAVTVSPYKPRVLQNYGLALLERGDTKGAIEQFRQAVKMADLPHVPAWDRRITNRDVTANLKALRGVYAR